MNRDIRQFVNHHLGAVEFQYDPILKGGSDRTFYRVRVPGGSTFIFMEYGTDVEENAYWAEINRFMTEIGMPVPRIIAFDFRKRFMLLEDLGDADLYSLRAAPWRKRRRHYLTALSGIHRLHRTPLSDVPASLKLCRGMTGRSTPGNTPTSGKTSSRPSAVFRFPARRSATGRKRWRR